MYFYSNVITIVICVNIGFVTIHSEHVSEKEGDSEIEIDKEHEELLPEDSYTFLALIDIVFTDGSKRTCTGTIIHDNVVITAAHCLSIYDLKVELTASFVVIGTKKMFDAGYEQYLPIERVIIHPDFKGWTADLALVYTFAGMMSDKPGKVVRLANEKSTVSDSDATVFSWGRCKEDEPLMTTQNIETPCSDEDETREKKLLRLRKLEATSSIRIHSDREKSSRHSAKNKTRTNKTKYSKSQQTKKRKHQRQRKSRKPKKESPTTLQKRFKKKKSPRSRRKTTFDLHNVELRQRYKTYRHNQSSFSSGEDQDSFEHQEENFKEINSKVYNKKKEHRKAFKRMSYYKNNWRRQMGNQKNTLTAEIFSFVNTQTCTKLTEKSMPYVYEIENPNEILCYTNEAFYITEEDSGAPALRQGRLVAVTVGGIDYEGEHVAVGMKIVCFCPWIVENLPNTDNEIQCCKKCCEPKKDEEHNMKHGTHKKKKYDFDDDYSIKNKS